MAFGYSKFMIKCSSLRLSARLNVLNFTDRQWSMINELILSWDFSTSFPLFLFHIFMWDNSIDLFRVVLSINIPVDHMFVVVIVADDSHVYVAGILLYQLNRVLPLQQQPHGPRLWNSWIWYWVVVLQRHMPVLATSYL